MVSATAKLKPIHRYAKHQKPKWYKTVVSNFSRRNLYLLVCVEIAASSFLAGILAEHFMGW